MKYTGAEIIIKMLEIHGIECIAGIPGGANLPMYHALGASNIRHLLARHEQGAGFIAQGQARSTGKVGVFFATSGPGATNALTAVADARMDSVPIICISGQVPSSLIGTDAFQEIDTYGLSVPITKHNYLVRSAHELLDVLIEAFAIAQEGRPGPVWIDVPKDVQCESIEIAAWPKPATIERSRDIDPTGIYEIAKLINEAQRPIVYLGGGAIHSDATSEILELVERTGALATTSLMGLGAMDSTHPANLGMLGMHGAQSTNQLLDECDTLIALGVRFDDRATGKVAEFCPHSKIIHIDIDRSEIAKIKQPIHSLVCDLKDALDVLLPHLEKREHPQWVARMNELKCEFAEASNRDRGLFDPYGLLDHCARSLRGQCIVTTDVGQHQMRVAQHFPFSKPRQLLTSGGLGTMGFGLPAAIGAALEHPKETVFCFTGDGSLLMNIQELALLAEQGLNVKVIVCNNNALGLVAQQQKLFYGKRYVASKFSGSPDFVGIARAFGITACDLGRSKTPETTLRELIQKQGPALINVPIEVNEDVFPMVPPGGSNTSALMADPALEQSEAIA